MSRRSKQIGLITAAVWLGGAGSVCGQVMNHFPQWSPDGAWILFGSDRTGTIELFIISPTGRELRQITHNDVVDVNIGWTPDSRILFQSEIGGRWIRYSVGVDGLDPQLASPPDSILAASTVGDRVVFSSTRDRESRLFTAKHDGTELRLLTEAGHAEQPSFSPDGRHLVFEERENAMVGVSTSRIMVSNPDGSDPRVVAEGGTDPKWSPDGSTILYKQWEKPRDGWVIATIGWDGDRLTLLRAGVHPDWSPDGHWIAFMTETGMDAHISVMRTDGSDVICLTCGS